MFNQEQINKIRKAEAHRNRHMGAQAIYKENDVRALETLFYEVKPYLYVAFVVCMFMNGWANNIMIKATTLGIACFAAHVLYSRYSHRGRA